MAPKWNTVAAPGGYVRTSVVNGARGQLRRWGIETKCLPDPLPPAVPDTSVELHDALQTLPERQRVAVVLRYFVDLDDDAIAEHLECQPATVRSLVHRGVKALQKEIEL
jgi:DNA-directed RNA polymerase specialized sigma24 family protein